MTALAGACYKGAMAGSEEGVRYRFGLRPVADKPRRYPEMERLIDWCATFDREGLAPVEGGASAGNLSFRVPGGFVITPTSSRLKAGLSWDRLVEVVDVDWERYEVSYGGAAPPSSDAFLHARIYDARADVRAVFHGHDAAVLAQADRLGVPVTGEERPFGTREDARETARDLGDGGYLIRRGHGFVAVGRTLDEAGERSLEVHRRAEVTRGRGG